MERIFVKSKNLAMEKQYCKVGSVTPLTANPDIITVLEYQYQTFSEKAANSQYTNHKMRDFFEQRAQKLQKTIATLLS